MLDALSCVQGLVRCNMTNSEIIGAGQDTARPAPKTKYPPVLDACCGSRMFWFDKSDRRCLYVDKRRETWQIDKGTPGTIGRSPIVVDPDEIADFTMLPFPSDTFDHVVFDPPHVERRQGTGIIERKYGYLDGDWREMLRRGFSECFRVLRTGGTLIFKWADTDHRLSDVLALTPERPLYGHRSGKKACTHWVAFIKTEDRTSCAPDSPAQDTVEICHTAPNTASTPVAEVDMQS